MSSHYLLLDYKSPLCPTFPYYIYYPPISRLVFTVVIRSPAIIMLGFFFQTILILQKKWLQNIRILILILICAKEKPQCASFKMKDESSPLNKERGKYALRWIRLVTSYFVNLLLILIVNKTLSYACAAAWVLNNPPPAPVFNCRVCY